MEYYIYIVNNELNGCGAAIDDNSTNYPISEQFFNDFKTLKTVKEQNEKYKWNGTDVVPNPDYDEMQANKRREHFNKEFFQTSLGYIRRKVTMKTDEIKDFLTDLLPTIALAVNSGQAVEIITYLEPDFTHDIEDWEALQVKKQATPQFIQDCFAQVSIDFSGN